MGIVKYIPEKNQREKPIHTHRIIGEFSYEMQFLFFVFPCSENWPRARAIARQDDDRQA